jgi:hypothetical protein
MAFLSKSLRIALLACLVAGLSGPASAEPAAWDQARVTAIAQQLAEASTAWQAAVLRQPEAGMRMQENARTLFEQSTMLAAHLAKGKDRGQTLDYYRSLKEVVDDAQELASRAPLDEPSMDAWAKVADLMRQIAPYY